MKKFLTKLFPVSKTSPGRVTQEERKISKTDEDKNNNNPRKSPGISTEEEYYVIDPNQKGLVIAFIQTKDRPGSKYDEESIKKTFESSLKCDVRIYSDKNTEEIEQTLSQIRKETCAEYNFLVTFVAGHGGSDENGEYLWEQEPYIDC